MNTWKIVWDAYYAHATRRAYLRELWRLLTWPSRIGLAIALVTFIGGAVDAIRHPTQDLPYLMLAGEVVLLAIVSHARSERFGNAYGSVETALAPAEKEDQRQHRYLMFKRALRERHVTRSHLQDLTEILQAKEDLESQHNFVLNRFVVFLLGFLTSAAVTLLRVMQPEQTAWLLLWTAVGAAALAPLLWMLPSRKGRLKELRYFIALYRGTPE